MEFFSSCYLKRVTKGDLKFLWFHVGHLAVGGCCCKRTKFFTLNCAQSLITESLCLNTTDNLDDTENVPDINYDNSESLLVKILLNLGTSTLSAKILNKIFEQIKEIVENSVLTTLRKVDHVLKSTDHLLILPKTLNYEK